ncbi:MAG TPA: GNAT family N-acetyltransferase [Dermatophilaceae bacterium]|nr:GNAT family N-acetyltransferase [Dermatophilaceae bacterium]
MIALQSPHARFHDTFMEAHFEFRGEFRNAGGMWSAPACESGYPGISFSLAEMKTVEGFDRYCDWLVKDSLDATPRPVVQVPTTHLFITRGEQFLGSIHLRHWLTDFLSDMGGHISYSVRPSARGQGVASEALRLALPRARDLGLERVLITTTTVNEASAKVIEHNGGVLEGVRRGMRRYWVEVSDLPDAAPRHERPDADDARPSLTPMHDAIAARLG